VCGGGCWALVPGLSQVVAAWTAALWFRGLQFMHVASSTQSYTAGIEHALRFCLVQFMSECKRRAGQSFY
jgi:hypothetical protein